jgi:hypothetical protein
MYGLMWAAFRFTRGALGERSVTDTRRCRYNPGNWHARQYVQSRSCSLLSTSHSSDICDTGPVIVGETAPPFRAEPRRLNDLPECVERLLSVWIASKRELAAWVARAAASCASTRRTTGTRVAPDRVAVLRLYERHGWRKLALFVYLCPSVNDQP